MKLSLSLLLSISLFFCISVKAAETNDPLESINRPIYSFNTALDNALLKPTAKAYHKVVPDLVQTGVGNFFGNIKDVSTLINNVLQFKFKDASTDLARVAFNTTIGLGGVLDVATGMGLQKNSEDFGQTLGAWGVPSGPYLVLPLFGPGSFRDSPASFVPLNAWGYVDHVPTRNVGYGTKLINDRTQLFEYETIVTGDDYIFVRDAYIGLRQQAVNDGVVDETFRESDF
jgi:phospholipid-binding lipoprotein MlaA